MPDPFEELYEREKKQLVQPPAVAPPDAFSQLYEHEQQTLLSPPSTSVVPAAVPQQVDMPPSITQDRPGWQWGNFSIPNPLSADYWKERGIRLAHNVDFLDRNTVRHVRQPLIEELRPSSYKTPSGQFNPLVNWIPGMQNQREETLENLYAMFEQKRGRAPSRMERLSMQQETTPWWAELLAEAPLAITPIGSAKYLGTGLTRTGGRFIKSGAQQGGLRGAGQQAAGYGLYGAAAPITPFWAVEELGEAGIRAAGRGIGALGRQARQLRDVAPMSVSQPSPPPTFLSGYPAGSGCSQEYGRTWSSHVSAVADIGVGTGLACRYPS